MLIILQINYTGVAIKCELAFACTLAFIRMFVLKRIKRVCRRIYRGESLGVCLFVFLNKSFTLYQILESGISQSEQSIAVSHKSMWPVDICFSHLFVIKTFPQI
jgi:hypothetical protein